MFKERLSELLNNNKMFQKDLASYIGYTVQAVNRWCKGETEPDLRTLVKIANFFDVSVDYLLGNDIKIIESDTELRDIEKVGLRKALVNAGYMKNSEDLTDEELERLMKFVKQNKDFIKDIK